MTAHFIWLGGEWRWQHMRAIDTASRVHGPVTLWMANPPEEQPRMFPARIVPLELPDWLRDHPIRLANVKDWYAYGILHEHGGIYLDFDTISLRPAWDLLPDGKQLLVSTEYHPDDDHPVRNNSAVMIGRADGDVLRVLAETALDMLGRGEDEWGAIGPHLVSEAALARPDEVEQAPYRALNGWSYHDIGDYYREPRDPGEDVRVIHLYSSDHPEWLEDFWTPTR